jgi:hypothetical protein
VENNKNIQNYWVSGLVHHPEFEIQENNVSDSVLETDSVLSSGEGRETPTLLGLLKRANLNPWTRSF